MAQLQKALSGDESIIEQLASRANPMAILELKYQTDPQKHELSVVSLDYLRRLRIHKKAMDVVYEKEKVQASYVPLLDVV